MDLTPYIKWIVFLHVAGAFMFVAGHGVSMFVVFQVRKERDRARLGALLDLSGWSLGVAGIGLLVLFLSGILAGIVLGSFGQVVDLDLARAVHRDRGPHDPDRRQVPDGHPGRPRPADARPEARRP